MGLRGGRLGSGGGGLRGRSEWCYGEEGGCRIGYVIKATEIKAKMRDCYDMMRGHGQDTRRFVQ